MAVQMILCVETNKSADKISDSEKVQEASAFRRKKKIEEIQIDKLLSNEMRIRTSNILNVLDKYLKRK